MIRYPATPIILNIIIHLKNNIFRNGSERSGVFCALYELTDSINKGYEFSVPSVCYKIKIRRPSAILNLVVIY